MAIEFECPSCSATIRVPDAYSGRQGKCPACNQRLLVPAIPIPSVRPEAGQLSQSPPMSADAAAGPSVPVSIPQKTGSVTRPRRSRRRPGRALVIGVPVIGFLLLLGIIAFTVSRNLPDLHGRLSGTLLTNRALPRTVIPWADTALGDEDQELLRTALRDSPERLTSEQMSCQLIGTDAGLEVLVTASTGSVWCVVETATDQSKPLQLWRKRERPRLNAERRAVFLKALRSYCTEKLRQIRGEKVIPDGVMVRDQVALASRLDAFGYAVEGRGENRLFRPALESEAGLLYFSVPEQTVSFMIQGRQAANGQKLFHGDYVVHVNAGVETAQPEANQTSADDKAAKTPNDAAAPKQVGPDQNPAPMPTGDGADAATMGESMGGADQ